MDEWEICKTHEMIWGTCCSTFECEKVIVVEKCDPKASAEDCMDRYMCCIHEPDPED